MLVHLLTGVIVTACALMMTWLVFRTLNRPMPGYLVPILIGGCLIGYGMYSEYTWRGRTLAQMPEAIQPVHELSGRSPFSPWAYLIPRVDQLSLVDTRDIRRHTTLDGIALFELLIVRRLYPTLRVPQIVDCTDRRRGDVDTNAGFDTDGMPSDVQWETLPSAHPLMKAVCG